MHLASNLDNEANQKEMLQFISAQSFREGISRGSRQHLFRFAREYADYLSLLRKNISIDILDSIDKEIQEHYSENLTLQGLGKKYYINSAYLGQIFRKFNERGNRAKQRNNDTKKTGSPPSLKYLRQVCPRSCCWA